MIRNYYFLLDKDMSRSKLGTVTVETIIEDFRNTGIQIVDITNRVIGIFEILKVKVSLHKNYFKTEINKFAHTKSYKYLY